MKKVLIRGVLVSLMLVGCYSRAVKEGGDFQVNPKRHVLVMGVDGVRPDTLEVAITEWMDGKTSIITEMRKDNALYTTGYVGGLIYNDEADFEKAMQAKVGWADFDYDPDAIYSYERLVGDEREFDITRPILNGLFNPYFTDWQEPNRMNCGSPVIKYDVAGYAYIEKDADNPRIIHPTAQTTSSYPGWSSMVAGVWADKHGLGHQPNCPVDDRCVYYHPVEDEMFIGPNFDNYPHFFRLIKEYSLNTFLATIMSWTPFHATIPSHYDYIYHPLRVDSAISGAVKSILTNDKVIPTVIFLGYDRSDWWGHSAGFTSGSKEAPIEKTLNYLVKEDQWLGEMMRVIKTRIDERGEEWLVVITSDHGGYDKTDYPDAFWDWDNKKAGDHGTWWTEQHLFDDPVGTEGGKTAIEKLVDVKRFADASRLIPIILWSNIATASIDTRYGVDGVGGTAAIAKTTAQVAESYDLSPDTTSLHPVVDIVPTILDFLDIPIEQSWDLDGESLFRKVEFENWLGVKNVLNDTSDIFRDSEYWDEVFGAGSSPAAYK